MNFQAAFMVGVPTMLLSEWKYRGSTTPRVIEFVC